MHYEKEQRIKIWKDIKNLCEEKEKCEEKLQELFLYGNFDNYFTKLQDLHYQIEIEHLEDTQKVLFTILDGLINYEYFNKHISDRDHYDYTKIVKRYEKILPFLVSDSEIKLKVPIHPNYTYNETLSSLIDECGLNEEIAIDILNPIFDTPKKLRQRAEAKREYKVLIDTLYEMLEAAEQRGKQSKKSIQKDKDELNELKKHL